MFNNLNYHQSFGFASNTLKIDLNRTWLSCSRIDFLSSSLLLCLCLSSFFFSGVASRRSSGDLRFEVVEAEVVAVSIVAIVVSIVVDVSPGIVFRVEDLYTKTVWQSMQTTLTPFTSGMAKFWKFLSTKQLKKTFVKPVDLFRAQNLIKINC